jgi:hypothetical protein
MSRLLEKALERVALPQEGRSGRMQIPDTPVNSILRIAAGSAEDKVHHSGYPGNYQDRN